MGDITPNNEGNVGSHGVYYHMSQKSRTFSGFHEFLAAGARRCGRAACLESSVSVAVSVSARGSLGRAKVDV